MSELDTPRQEVKSEMTKEKLETLLRSHGVPLGKWGVGHAKTVEHLLAEVASGESFLNIKDGQIVRDVISVAMSIYYQRGEEVLRLMEEKQVFTDGHERVRNDLVSMGEKMNPGENPEDAMHRALREELKIEGLQSVIERPTIVEEIPSGSYPGIFSKHIRYRYDVVLQEKDFKPEGYVEVQPDKTTYFIWKKVDSIPGV